MSILTSRQARAEATRAMRLAGIPQERIQQALELMVRPRRDVHLTRGMKAEVEDRLTKEGMVCLRVFKSGNGLEIVSNRFVTLAPRYHFEKSSAHKKSILPMPPRAKRKKKRQYSPESLEKLRENGRKTQKLLKERRDNMVTLSQPSQ
jgi:hypothetical protein